MPDSEVEIEDPKPLRGQLLMIAVINQIIASPRSWYQGNWHSKHECGTTHCAFGWAQVLGGCSASNETAFADGRRLLELSFDLAEYVSNQSRTFGELYRFTQAWIRNGYPSTQVDPYDPSEYQPLKEPT